MQLNEVMNAIEKALDDEREEISASVWISIEKRVQEALRAQADARPVAEWQTRYIGDPRQPGTWTRAQSAENARRVYDECPNHTDEHGWQVRPLYEHPAEAWTPGLSDEAIDRALVNMGLDRADLAPEVWERIRCAVRGLTRASATTVAEPSDDAKRLEHIVAIGWEGLRKAWERFGEDHDCETALEEIRAVIDADRARPQAAQQQAEPSDIPADIADALERTDWTPEEALRWYAAGKHFDVVNGRTRILDTGSVASIALKRTSPEYHAMKGADASFDAPVAQQQAEPGADEQAAFEAWASKRRMDLRREANNPDEYLLASTADAFVGWQAHAAQSVQRAGVAPGVREVIPLSDFSVELRFHSCRQAQAFIRAAAPTQQQEGGK